MRVEGIPVKIDQCFLGQLVKGGRSALLVLNQDEESEILQVIKDDTLETVKKIIVRAQRFHLKICELYASR